MHIVELAETLAKVEEGGSVVFRVVARGEFGDQDTSFWGLG